MTMPRLDPIHILIVEDNPGDVDLLLESLEQCRLPSMVSVASDGEEALSFLRHEAGFAAAVRPDIIFLDLNLPRKSGREVLREIKGDVDLTPIPVIILSSSSAAADVADAYTLHANAFVTKPLGFEQFMEVGRSVQDFWLGAVRLPRA
jgi:chemotaxis family two-component system response regulator Rcp1